MKLEENETTIVFDYAGETVSFFTTRRGERDNLIKRIGEENILKETDNNDQTWHIKAKMEAFRNPYMVSKVIHSN